MSVLVFCEIKDGKLKKTAAESLSAGKKVADAAGVPLIAFAGGSGAAGLAEAVGRYGAEKLYVATDAQLDDYSYEPYAAAMKQLCDQAEPVVILMGGTANGRDLAPRLAARLGVGVASDIDRLEWVDGKIEARRPVYSGKAFATVEIDAKPAIATTRPNAFPVEQAGSAAAAVVELDYTPAELKSKVVETHTPDAGEISVAEADIIVSGGRGLKEPQNFSYIRDLAQTLGAAVGASRATVDAGWIDHQHQVGQTGRVVSPTLYIAAGISGAIQHLAGMSTSKHIVAINKDPEAPIFRIADLGVVGDLFQILPALTEAVKQEKAGH
jgi:electron transfer flavoprotein alpha subunit